MLGGYMKKVLVIGGLNVDILAKTNDIKDVIAFPKTQSASDLMSEAPSEVSEAQLQELGIKIVKESE